MEELIAAHIASGGEVKKIETGATIGITGKDWSRLVRGVGEPVEVEPLIAAHAERGPVRVRAGHGVI
jgi:hypothetical protein